MSKSTISTFKLFELFPDNEAARLRLASFVDAIVGKRLTYARLIAKVPA